MAHRRRRGTAIVDTPEGILVASENGKLFLLPGGGAGPHESRKGAAIRELKEETGLEALNCTYLFSHKGRIHKDLKGGHFWGGHKVFLIKAKGVAEPRREIKQIAYFNGSNVRLSTTTRRIIDRYNDWKNSVTNYAPIRCTHCGAGLNIPNPLGLIKCEYCGTTYHEKIALDT